jgi:hypothetical protein
MEEHAQSDALEVGLELMIHTNSLALVCERTIPTELSPLVAEFSDNFYG